MHPIVHNDARGWCAEVRRIGMCRKAIGTSRARPARLWAAAGELAVDGAVQGYGESAKPTLDAAFLDVEGVDR